MDEKTVVILGATGSIGTQTLDVINKLNSYKVVGIVFGKNKLLGEKIIKQYSIKYYFSKRLSNVSSITELLEKTRPDIVISAIPGFYGVVTSFEAAKHTKRIALANKEALVCAGPFFKKECEKNNVELIPVDSEHSAIFQIFGKNVEKILITASGGAVRNYKNIENLTPSDILNHPVWNMGQKITVDSSTMVNKAFEVIEAYELFEVDNIEVLIHPTGTVHGAVFYKDGVVKIHFGFPDMKIPISYALTYPNRCYTYSKWPKFSSKNFIFEKVDEKKYPAFFYGKKLINNLAKRIAFNAADEIAVEKFLQGKIKFHEISKIIINTCEKIDGNVRDLNDIFELDKLARKIANNF
ncbi:1-deoxy-D-xylulose 5-phosphate reductoisomerase [Thermosipho melanesiensis]|uniref:1-deoxy-D-xylulose 5-phosphate reductoisomerase n=2 Tax=Thermosipho melanesiensis TaxID=46541 RepID=A6LJ15_THEM4|nr:1-deoxy-D-xylulose-5-phosphate reductoisomerase [Thermosipho melanesiensis]ABR29916.1 1-deoxy-D-xylulose-5-phosphate reductoisomerase [Thermosipho melanesiensis BI429]APT73124.1 1-deoxy-D-xylulose 5-phosphate reductoisomerase [Thermosipho melanesiensis]OOC38522.1 1-deoxy-D-xylulose 5-phosphate reductoisomerase [Thermosipho melanesiensis]OOC40326.1 1-deoxy-D-xylulose 5-phosphate reductoisomerase [Thermosipho melanesiensis]OOC40590.1 1-deoxy-D-xylulose 5-phosphate reductoisomerase [Thermosiph